MRLGRIEGYGNPLTGELWMEAVKRVDPLEASDGVAVSANALLGTTPGYCDLDVVSDGTSGSNPDDTFEYYTIDRDGTMTGDPNDDSSFDPMTCYDHLKPEHQNSEHLNLFQPSGSGVGCALQHIGNFYARAFDHVYLDVDQFSGNLALQGPYGPPLTTGTVPTPPGRNPPIASKGLWDYGMLAAKGQPGDAKDMWIYFKDGADTDFGFSGYLLAEVREDCGPSGTGNGADEDCDGVDDNGCAAFDYGQPCFFDNDCVGGTCEGETLVSGFGFGGPDLVNDVAGICTAICGDGVTEGLEECDDGDTTSGDGCESDCTLPPDCDPPLGPMGYGTVMGATLGGGNDLTGSCGGGQAEDVVHAFTAPASGTVCIDTIGSTYDTVVYLQTTCGDPASAIACNDDGLYIDSRLEVAVTNGTTYHVVVDGYSTQSGTYTLNVNPGACPPACGDFLCNGSETCASCAFDCGTCDDCDLATMPPLAVSAFGQYTGTTTGDGADQFGFCGTGSGEDTIYQFTPAANGTVCANTFGSLFDTELYVRTTCDNPDTQVACNDDAGGTHSQVQFNVLAGQPYYLVLDSKAAGGGSYTLNINSGACPNHCSGSCGAQAAAGCWCDAACMANGDCCPDACATCGHCNDCSPPLSTTGYGDYTGSTAGTGNQEDSSCSGGTAPDVIYQFIAPASELVCIDTFGSAYDTHLQVQDSCGNFEIACNEDANLAAGLYQSRIELSAEAGHTYFVVVDGYGAADAGNYNLSLSSGSCCPPGQIDLGNACEAIQTMAGGFDHSCAVTTNGKLYCWGDNAYGQLGIGSTTDSSLPIRVGSATDWTTVSAGSYHSCGLRGTGDLYCWGINDFGQTGTGNPLTTRTSPTLVSAGWTGIGLGDDHSCGIRNEGGQLKAYCWGYGLSGQLGDGGTATRSTPSLVFGGYTNWQQVTGGAYFSCGRRATGEAYCWGDNYFGELGDGGIVYSTTTPSLVTGGYSWSDIDAGRYHACGRRTTNQLYCWGDNTYGALGTNDMAIGWSPRQVGTANDWEIARAGGDFTCGRRNQAGEKRLYCWGYNGSGTVGDGTYTNRLVPTQVSGSAINWAAFETGSDHVCGVRTGGLSCWGWAGAGQLGDGLRQVTPFQAQGSFTNWSAQSSGKWNGCGIRANQLYCWGDNTFGQIGNGTTTFASKAVAVPGATDFVDVSVGAGVACGIRTNGLAYCWGFNGNGELGDGTTMNRNVPTLVLGGLTGWQSIRVGEGHTCGIASGRAYCWGFGANGELGNGLGLSSSLPVEVFNAQTGWSSIDPGDNHTCGVRSNLAYCWGFNGNGQLGNGTTTSSNAPALVSNGYMDWLSLSANGNGGTCGVRTSGSLYCWGFNGNGQLGDGTLTSHPTPAPVIGPASGWQAVTMGYAHACGIRGDRMYCWGFNGTGQLGNATIAYRTAPTEVHGWTTGWLDVNSYYHSVCARRGTGELHCWGSDDYAQLGSRPVTIPRPIDGP